MLGILVFGGSLVFFSADENGVLITYTSKPVLRGSHAHSREDESCLSLISHTVPTQSSPPPVPLPPCIVFFFLICFLFPTSLHFKSSYVPFCHLKHSLGFHVKRSFLYLESIFKQNSGELCFDRMSAPSGYCRETGPWT